MRIICRALYSRPVVITRQQVRVLHVRSELVAVFGQIIPITHQRRNNTVAQRNEWAPRSSPASDSSSDSLPDVNKK